MFCVFEDRKDTWIRSFVIIEVSRINVVRVKRRNKLFLVVGRLWYVREGKEFVYGDKAAEWRLEEGIILFIGSEIFGRYRRYSLVVARVGKGWEGELGLGFGKVFGK